MGGCLANKNKLQNEKAQLVDGKDKDADNKAKEKEKEKDKKNMNMNVVFEEIMDIKDLQIKGAMLLSETEGKPRETYETIENIAPVSYGLIKKVKHRITSKTRAMRIIKKELIEVREEETLLFKELALLRSLDHPNIIKLYEFYRDEKYYYLLSEYCEEGELFKIIKKENKGFNEHTVAHIMRQLLSVVYYCHSGNIINRDLRPENILVESIETKFVDGKELPFFNIRVSDFKSARSYKNSKKLNKKVGNPYYIAPEVLKRKYNEKCDIWSCGIIMYILLTGKPPFSGSTDKEVLDKVELGVFEYFDKDLASNTPECKSLLKELLRIDPVKRLSAADALKHPWLKTFKVQSLLDKGFVFESFRYFMQFSPEQKFQQAALAYMVHHLTDLDDVKEIRKMFEHFDSNNDGKLSHNEILEGFKNSLAIIQNEKEFLKVIKKIDQDKSGFIEYEEFIRACINKSFLLTEEKLQITFKLFDKDGSGSITPEELKMILGLSSKYSDKVWNEIINQIEHNNDDEVTYEEFKNMMLKLVIKN